jgi:hypothetical protein
MCHTPGSNKILKNTNIQNSGGEAEGSRVQDQPRLLRNGPVSKINK